MQGAHPTDKSSVEKKMPADDRDLEVSYGMKIPQPAQKKGDFVAFGILAGSTDMATSVQGVRTTTFGDSVTDNAKNI
jgi:hypothetical protein